MTAEISLFGLVQVYLLMLVPLAVLVYLQLGLVRETLIGLVRMTLQLLLVGIYLKYIFELNRLSISLLWLALMMVAANFSILGKAGLVCRRFFWRSLFCVSFSTLLISGWFMAAVIHPDPWYDARYLVPVAGMILGNCLRSNVMSLERFYSGLREHEAEYTTRLMLGATLDEAVQPWLRSALRAAFNPALATMATMGLVSLPGMMTGQILGGSLPLTAIKYQIAIMVCIFSAMVLTAWLNLRLSLPAAFDRAQRLRLDIFRGKG